MKTVPIVILAAGDYPTHPVPQQMLAAAERVVCLDGAADAYYAHTGRLPDVVVGDGDSVSEQLRNQLGTRFVQEAEQDTNDLCKAVRYLKRQGAAEAVVLGATGKREDHTLGNIFHLPDLSEMLKLTMVTDFGTFYVPAAVDADANTDTAAFRRFEMEVEAGTQISVFNINAKGLCAKGLRWPLSDFTSLWQGTLNEVAEPHIEITGHGSFLVYIAHPN